MKHAQHSIIVAALALVVPIGALAQEATPEPVATPDFTVAEPATVTCEGEDAPKPDVGYVIDPALSLLRYRVREELMSVGATTAVGETRAVSGQLIFDSEGNPLPCSEINVDLRTLKSDSDRRDGYLYNNTLESEKYPLATFVLSEVEGLEGPLVEGEEMTFTLVGNFTVHGVTKLVRWETTATLDDGTITGKAITQFEMPDFAITPPKVGPVLGLSETVQLEAEIVAKSAE